MDADRRTAARIDEDTMCDYFEAGLLQDDGEAARDHADAGLPIDLREADTPVGTVIKQYPEKRRKLARFRVDGEMVIEPAG